VFVRLLQLFQFWCCVCAIAVQWCAQNIWLIVFQLCNFLGLLHHTPCGLSHACVCVHSAWSEQRRVWLLCMFFAL
jgi:hypothetical protein